MRISKSGRGSGRGQPEDQDGQVVIADLSTGEALDVPQHPIAHRGRPLTREPVQALLQAIEAEGIVVFFGGRHQPVAVEEEGVSCSQGLSPNPDVELVANTDRFLGSAGVPEALIDAAERP